MRRFLFGLACGVLACGAILFGWIRSLSDGGLPSLAADLRRAQEAERNALRRITEIQELNSRIEEEQRRSLDRIIALEAEVSERTRAYGDLERSIEASRIGIEGSSGLIGELGEILKRAIIFDE
jgi:chromosome segregation ATPase